jgi:predicted metal-binding protein
MLTSIFLDLPVCEWAVLSTSKLTFSPELTACCKSNTCGNYGKSWTCPPACGTPEEQMVKILSYKQLVLFTSKHNLEDSFDYEGMERGRELHALLTIEVKKRLGDVPVYGAGKCPVCCESDGNSCSFPKPCPFPEKMIGSIEAAGIDVTKLSKIANITYNNGPNTVTFFSMALIKNMYYNI